MTLNKSMKKNLVTTISCVALGLSGFAMTQLFHSQFVSATDSQVEAVEKEKEVLTSKISTLNLSKQVSDKLNEMIKSEKKASQEELDNLSYYVIKMWESGVITTSSDGTVETSDDLAFKLLSYYKYSEVDPSFEFIEDGTKIKTLRTLKEPSQFTDVIEEIQEKSEKLVDQSLENQQKDQSDKNKEIDVELDIKTDLIDK